MRAKMRAIFPTMWLVLSAFLLTEYYAEAASSKDVVSRRCHQCGVDTDVKEGVGEPCGSRLGPVRATLCPADQPYCATVATSPNFTSVVTCAATAEKPCSLTYSDEQYTMLCVCTSHLCNAPFSSQLRQELIDFSRTHIPRNGSGTDFVEALWNVSRYGDTVDDTDSIYKLITVPIKQTIFFPKTTTITSKTQWVNLTSEMSVVAMLGEIPRAEAFKNEATVPSSDDEDFVEGSGSYGNTHAQHHSPSAPAAPSSYLPADENGAATLALDLATLASLLLYAIQ
ncbi:uncharacterized protein LOC113239507 [Hyposmocoma kahamanoa]|uniref:uncharacterized protein LOC113239507 n=1 Tax=Hyposmocoma kahamanoa TaxID=1477025 RepID=UPI000E6D5C4E|nr:uncharacterized protein LOC113239507 [Hyposmocoma kahamanoa]